MKHQEMLYQIEFMHSEAFLVCAINCVSTEYSLSGIALSALCQHFSA